MSAGPAMYPSLHGRVVFITGGGSGIGASLTQAFARQGAKVAFVDIALEDSVLWWTPSRRQGMRRYFSLVTFATSPPYARRSLRSVTNSGRSRFSLIMRRMMSVMPLKM